MVVGEEGEIVEDLVQELYATHGIVQGGMLRERREFRLIEVEIEPRILIIARCIKD